MKLSLECNCVYVPAIFGMDIEVDHTIFGSAMKKYIVKCMSNLLHLIFFAMHQFTRYRFISISIASLPQAQTINGIN